MRESPRWLISKGRIEDAYKIVFKKKRDIDFPQKPIYCEIDTSKQQEEPVSCGKKFKNIFRELTTLYGPAKQRRIALICHYSFCITSLSYYVTGEKV